MNLPFDGPKKPARKLTNSEKAEFDNHFAPRLLEASKGYQVATSKQLEAPGGIAAESLRFEQYLSSALPGIRSNDD
jgi:hypothetical protein